MKYSAMKMNELLLYVTKQMNLKKYAKMKKVRLK